MRALWGHDSALYDEGFALFAARVRSTAQMRLVFSDTLDGLIIHYFPFSKKKGWECHKHPQPEPLSGFSFVGSRPIPSGHRGRNHIWSGLPDSNRRNEGGSLAPRLSAKAAYSGAARED